MKEIKEEKTHEVKETITYYEAIDGTRFENKEECRKYETSALGMMRAKVKPFMSEPKCAWTTMGGLDDHQVVAVSIPNEKDINVVLQWLFLECPWYLNDCHEERKEEVVNTVNTAYANQDVLLFGINCDNNYYFINSRQNIINNLNNLDKKDNA